MKLPLYEGPHAAFGPSLPLHAPTDGSPVADLVGYALKLPVIPKRYRTPIRLRLVRAWVAALRSGKYLPNKGQLRALVTRRRWGYCCLGVYCAIRRAHGVGEWTTRTGSDSAVLGDLGTFAVSAPKEGEFRNEVNLSSPLQSELSLPNQHHEILQRLNDGGATFRQIAKVIAHWYVL